MILRQFNQDGIRAFSQWLSDCRLTPTLSLPLHLLEDVEKTETVAPTRFVEWRRFSSKGDAARYLQPIVAPLVQPGQNAGLWTWLSLFFFDEVCPTRNGHRVVRNDYHYVFEPQNTRHYYRHLLFVSWHILQVAPVHNRLFLSGPVSTLDHVTQEVAKRLYLTRIPCIFEVLDRLYWDAVRERPRVGIVGSVPAKPGDLTSRLPTRLRQLEKTYDLMSINADTLIELLGDEFQNVK